MEMPKVGEIIDGYVFNGGDPSDERSWSKNQEVALIKDKERTEHVSKADRALIKNFGTDKDAAAYIKSINPELDVVTDDDMVYVRKKGEKEYKALDPKGFDYEDILDIGADVGGGLAEGLVAAGAGFGSGGALAIPAAAATGAGLETAKQAIGKYLGVRKDLDSGDIALSGAISGAFPAAAAAKKAFTGAKNYVKEGLIGKATGLSKEEVEHYTANPNLFENSNPKEEALDLVKYIAKKDEAPRKAASDAYDALELMRGNKTKNISDIKTNFLKEIEDAYGRSIKEGDKLQGIYDEIIAPRARKTNASGSTEVFVNEVPNEAKISELYRIRNLLKDKISSLENMTDDVSYERKKALKELKKKIGAKIDEAGKDYAKEQPVALKEMADLSGNYKKAIGSDLQGNPEIGVLPKNISNIEQAINFSEDMSKGNANKDIVALLEKRLSKEEKDAVLSKMRDLNISGTISDQDFYSKVVSNPSISNLIASAAQGLTYNFGGKASSALASRVAAKELSKDVLKNKKTIREMAKNIAKSRKDLPSELEIYKKLSRYFAPSVNTVVDEE